MENSKQAKYGDTIKVNFSCTLEDGTMIDSTIEKGPLTIKIGKSGFIEGFEKSFIGMNPGEKKSVRVPAEKAYGPYEEELKKVVSRTQFPSELQPEVGLQFKFQFEDHEKNLRVTEVTDSTVILDANHPYAGKDLLFDVELVDILKRGPDANMYFHLGTALQDKGLYEEAIEHYLDAIETDTEFTEAYFNLGAIYHLQGLLDDAISSYQKVLQLEANHLKAIINLGNAERQKGNIDQAIASYNHALLLNPDYADTQNGLGAAFLTKGEPDHAIPYFQKAIALDSAFIEAHNNLGLALRETGQIQKAIDSFKEALRLNPNFAEAHLNLSNALLLLGNLQEGWKEYEWRMQISPFNYHYHKFEIPWWDGSPLNGKTILVSAEYMTTDEIMFASCFPELIAQVEKCIVECDRRLVPLFYRSFPNAIYFEKDGTESIYPPELSTANFKIALGSLPQFYRTDLDRFPAHNSYLLPDPQHLETWQKRFAQLETGIKVGISWKQEDGSLQGVKNSLPLEQWAKVFSLPGIIFVNLQAGNVSSELSNIREKIGITIHDWVDTNPLEDLDNFAAQLAALDLIISFDNETAHLAGALGKPVWTLLSYIPDWRWMINREDSPWYPTMRLFRQLSPGDWISVIEKVTEELKKLSE
ncbi:MAG: tetratricopeptide repeat protein [Thermodesulfovibrionales bacterium]|nr:tetratricopeptide repeat protein [Thermodesulfovibrionales bacterium]